MSTCRDPKNFYNFNLLRALQTKLGKYPQEAEFSHPFQFSLAVLALCSSGVDFEKRMTFVEDITGSVLQDQSVVYDTDTLAIQVLALTCVRESLKRQRSKPMKIGNLNINQAINKASKELLGRQMKDSTFGENEVTAALSAQVNESSHRTDSFFISLIITFCWFRDLSWGKVYRKFRTFCIVSHANSWDIELNTRRGIPYLQATMYYFVFYIKIVLTRKSRLYSRFKRRKRCHLFMALNWASDVPAADWLSQTHVWC